MTVPKNNLVKISYIGDLSYSPPDGVLLIDGDGDYVGACHVLSCEQEPEVIWEIWVRSLNHYEWLRDFVEQIGRPCTFEKKTPRLILADRWNVVLPDWLDDSDVLNQKLLELTMEVNNRTTFANRLLTHLLGGEFQADMISSSNLVDVLSVLVDDEAKSMFKKYPILHRCLQTKCEEWEQTGVDNWAKEISRQLPENAYDIWQYLSFWAGLHGYPEKILEYVLPPQQVLFVKKIPVEAVTDLPLEATAREQICTHIKFFFEEIQGRITSGKEFRKIVECMSGRLFLEYQCVADLLRSNRFSTTIEDIEKVRDKFISCPGVNANQLRTLVKCVKPERPSLLEDDKDWSEQEWIRWTVEEYTPYRTWQIYNHIYDEEVEKTVRRFSSWYINEYASIHKDSDLSLIHSLKSLSTTEVKDEVSIILLIDCLPIPFMTLLDDALRNAGFSRHDSGYRFAPLPTITECSKPMLLSGEWEGSEKSYETILKTRAISDWGGRNIVYLSNLKALIDMKPPTEATIAVLNYLDGDELLHADVESKNTSYEDELYRLFTRIADAVNRAFETWECPPEAFNVHVVTDHGACMILEEERRAFDSKIVNKLFSNERHRFAVVDEAEIDEIPKNLWELGHQFKRPFVADNKIYFLPNGHSTVRFPSKRKGYLHGGITPEEVIVPTALYRKVKAAWIKPAVRFLSLDLEPETGRAKFYIQRVVNLEIEIRNLNSTDIKILRASVLSPETDVKGCDSPIIPAHGESVLHMNCYFEKTALEQQELEIEISYEIAGEAYTLTHTLGCEFKSAIRAGFSLKDL